METLSITAHAATPPAEFFHFPANQPFEVDLPSPQLLQEEEDFLNQTIKEVDTLALKGAAFLLMMFAAAGCAITLLW